MVLGYIGGPLVHARRAVDIYRAAGDRAGHPDPGRPRVPRSPANARSDPRIRSLTLDAGRC